MLALYDHISIDKKPLPSPSSSTLASSTHAHFACKNKNIQQLGFTSVFWASGVTVGECTIESQITRSITPTLWSFADAKNVRFMHEPTLPGNAFRRFSTAGSQELHYPSMLGLILFWRGI